MIRFVGLLLVLFAFYSLFVDAPAMRPVTQAMPSLVVGAARQVRNAALSCVSGIGSAASSGVSSLRHGLR